jgi:hypothetical protein
MSKINGKKPKTGKVKVSEKKQGNTNIVVNWLKGTLKAVGLTSEDARVVLELCVATFALYMLVSIGAPVIAYIFLFAIICAVIWLNHLAPPRSGS